MWVTIATWWQVEFPFYGLKQWAFQGTNLDVYIIFPPRNSLIVLFNIFHQVGWQFHKVLQHIFIMGRNTPIASILDNGADDHPIMVDMLEYLKKMIYVPLLKFIIIIWLYI